MHVYVVYAHPSKESFTHQVLTAFVNGLTEGGHTVEIADLYAMDFKTDMDPEQYRREIGNDSQAPLPADVQEEQRKIEKAQGLAFVYPVWWSDCPAKLKGWFDRVFTYGYAYFRGGPEPDPRTPGALDIDKAVVLCPAGTSMEELREQGIVQSMECIMVGDRLGRPGIKQTAMEILAGTSGDDGTVKRQHLKKAFEIGLRFATPAASGGLMG